MVRRERHLAHQMGGDEDRAAFRRQALQEIADPVDAFRVEPVHGLVEEERLRVPEQRRGDAEPLPHAERELPRSLLRDLAQSDHVDQLVNPPALNAMCLGESKEVVVRRTPGMDRARFEQRADLGEWCGVVAVGLTVDRDGAGGRAVQAEDQAHGGRLPGAVRAEKARHDARLHRECEIRDRGLVAVALRKVACFDHRKHSLDGLPSALCSQTAFCEKRMRDVQSRH